MNTEVFVTHSAGDTERLAEEISKTAKSGDVFAFKGDLGAGKTCFSRGFARGMGYKGDVNSPTFALINEYLGGRLDIYHFDMYRVSDWNDLYTTGYFEYLKAGGVLLVEWSENIESALPENTVTINIENTGGNDRKITVTR
jgi:tRNA threonylcarbamoyladenosine biosynthesis protein TsaE